MFSRVTFSVLICVATTFATAHDIVPTESAKHKVEKLTESSTRFFVVPAKLAIQLEKSKLGPIIDSAEGMNLYSLTARQAEALAHDVHEKQGTCGGFIDLSSYLGDQKNPRVGFRDFVKPQAVSKSKNSDFKGPSTANLAPLLKQFDRGEYEKLLADVTAFSDRSARTQNGVNAAQWFKDSFQRWANDVGRTDVETNEVSTGGWYRQPSVYARIPGANPNLPAVVLGAHMDTFPDNKPGADDDGSGTAAVLAAYKAFLKSGIRVNRDIYFILYAAEEVGLVGSGEVVRYFGKKGIQVKAVMQLDMIGYRSPKDSKEMYFVADHTDAGLTSYTKLLAEKYLGFKSSDVEDIECGYACSDHASWNRQGVAAVFPFEATFQNYNKQIHTSADTLSLVDMSHAFKYVRLAGIFVADLAEVVQ